MCPKSETHIPNPCEYLNLQRPVGPAGFLQEPLETRELNLSHISPNCLPQPWAGFFLLQGCNSGNKESRSHSTSSPFLESLKSQDMLGVTADETQCQSLCWHKQWEDGMSFMYSIHEIWEETSSHSGVCISERTLWGGEKKNWKWFRKEL